MPENNIRCTEARMLVRKPVEEVFQAFIDPELTKNFWFTKGSGKLRVKEPVIWQWEMYNVSAKVTPVEIIENEKIAFEWGDPSLLVEFRFRKIQDNSTYRNAALGCRIPCKLTYFKIISFLLSLYFPASIL